MFEVGYLAAFLGGVLTLLPSCGPLVLPAFFAYAFRERGRLVEMTLVFFAGFLLTFLPLGLGVAWLTKLFVQHSETVFAAAGLLFVAFGLLTLAGRGLPGASGPLQPAGADPRSIFLFGATFGLAGSACTAPILGAVFTFAALSGSPLRSLLLLATFAFGMIAPLLALALGFERLRLGERAWRWGRPLVLRLGGRTLAVPPGNLVAGLVFIILGLTFAVTRSPTPILAFASRTGLLDFYFDANTYLLTTSFAPAWVGGSVVFALGVGVAVVTWRRRHQDGSS